MSNTDKPVNGHPNPFTIAPLSYDDAPPNPPLSAREVAEIRQLQEEAISRRRSISHRAAGNRGDVSVKKSRDGAQYVRQQRGHSWLLEWVVFGVFTMWIRPIYLAVSPNHYFHL